MSLSPVRPAGPLGVFDSGVGGLTVARAIRDALPGLPIRYLGDTARLPYGTKSAETVRRYALGCVAQLRDQGPLCGLVVACNTASAHALTALRELLGDGLPLVGVIEPGAAAAVAATRGGRVGVIATAGTIASGRYAAAIGALAPAVTVHSSAAPLLVPLAEEGLVTGPIVEAALDHYLADHAAAGVDTLLLGCTHYPLLAPAIEAWFARRGLSVTLVDSATATATALHGQLGERPGRAAMRIFSTDPAPHFAAVAARIVGAPVTLEHLDLARWSTA